MLFRKSGCWAWWWRLVWWWARVWEVQGRGGRTLGRHTGHHAHSLKQTMDLTEKEHLRRIRPLQKAYSIRTLELVKEQAPLSFCFIQPELQVPLPCIAINTSRDAQSTNHLYTCARYILPANYPGGAKDVCKGQRFMKTMKAMLRPADIETCFKVLNIVAIVPSRVFYRLDQFAQCQFLNSWLKRCVICGMGMIKTLISVCYIH